VKAIVADRRSIHVTDSASAPADPESAVAELSYEQARDELVSIVARLEAGQVPLEESMTLWQRGEALAAHCTAWLDDAQARIADAGVVAVARDDQT
jgi:exodeoxyribonuclease VII small subunit